MKINIAQNSVAVCVDPSRSVYLSLFLSFLLVLVLLLVLLLVLILFVVVLLLAVFLCQVNFLICPIVELLTSYTVHDIQLRMTTLRTYEMSGFPYGLVVRIPAFHVGGSGSIPGVGAEILAIYNLCVIGLHIYICLNII